MGQKKANIIDTKLKYELYEKSVQNPDYEVDFITEQYLKRNNQKPSVLREDFCGTGLLCCEWANKNKNYKAIGLDLDSTPIEYGKNKHLSKLNEETQKRVTYLEKNVLDKNLPKADVIAALNFSYFIFKERSTLLTYFKNVYKNLNNNGFFLLDIFGGSDCYSPTIDEIEHDDFTYYWDLDKFNPINNHCTYYIHFKHNKKKYNQVFEYEWRMWSTVEIREILKEAGFNKTTFYWEEDDEEGEGNGNFYPSENEENCDAWVGYLIAEK